ncbi:putative Ig domain-containing protein [Legionella sp.]|uniref:putative Ig domain-containing protein n=1 Tax=Legionella sp. TaxID=459 RepID=UPI003CBF6BAD
MLTATPSQDTEVNVPYSQANTVFGGTAPYTYSVSTGTVPAGTSLDTTGTVYPAQ